MKSAPNLYFHVTAAYAILRRMKVAWLLPLVLLVLAGCERTEDAPASQAPAATAEAAAPPHAPPADPGAGEATRHDVLPPLDGQDLPTFTTEASSADVSSFGEAAPILRDVRIGQHEDFDRIVFEFDSEGLPQWHVAYLDGPPADCGTGAEVPLAGDATLQVRFSGANAHTEAGESTSGPRRRAVGQPSLRELVRTCDFEAEVTWVAGVAGRKAYRPRVLVEPSRLVLDIAH